MRKDGRRMCMLPCASLAWHGRHTAQQHADISMWQLKAGEAVAADNSMHNSTPWFSCWWYMAVALGPKQVGIAWQLVCLCACLPCR